MTSEDAPTILLIDDDAGNRRATEALLQTKGYRVEAASNGIEGRRHFNNGVRVVVTDLRMPKSDGMDVLRTARRMIPHVPVIVITGKGSEETAVAALKEGAFHYLTKPVNPTELLHLIRQACEKSGMAAELALLRERSHREHGYAGMIGTSEAMQQVFERLKMAADTPSTVLVTGESGTGKELVARALHTNSQRKNEPFVTVNCAAIPEALIESELFGHVKGAFTGATGRREGKFQAADGGTLLIDEIGEMDLDLQSKLLRVLESNRVTPVGSNEEIEVDTRIIASTNKDLQGRVAADEFRDDLFYRLNVVSIPLPPLRERREDIPLLVRTFIQQLRETLDRPTKDITPEALKRLMQCEWPGNVRELRNMIEGIIVMSSREVIDVSDLPEHISGVSDPAQTILHIPPDMTMAEIEKEAIVQALTHAGGNRTEASEKLGISVRTLQRKIKTYQIDA